MLMIHERKLDKQLHINGPLTMCVATVAATLHEIEASIAIQNEGFENLIRGSKVTMEEVLRRAPGNWYIEANEPPHRPTSPVRKDRSPPSFEWCNIEAINFKEP